MDEENKIEIPNKMNWLLPTLAIVVLIVGGYFFMNNGVNETESTQTSKPSVTSNEEIDSLAISIEGGMFYFKPNEIRVKKGETVKITFTNKEGFHDFVLDEFNVKTNQIKAGESATIEFTPDEVGEFQFYCSVGDHQAKGMVGKLIVGN